MTMNDEIKNCKIVVLNCSEVETWLKELSTAVESLRQVVNSMPKPELETVQI